MDVIWNQEEEEHFLTYGFRKAITYIQPFHFDLSQLDKRDFSDFIKIAFEPKFVELIKDLSITNVYVHRKLRPVFDACEYFVRSEGNFASDYYRYGHMGLTHIYICEQHFFDEDWILFLMGAVNSTYGKVGTSGLIRKSL